MHRTQPPGDYPRPDPVHPFPLPPVERLIRLGEVLSMTGESRTQCYAHVSTGLHPAPRKDGRASLWVLSEVQAYVTQKIARLPRKS